MSKIIDNFKIFPQRFNKLIFFMLIAISVFIPLYPKFPLIGVSGTYVSIRFEDILILLIIIFWALANLSKVRQILNLTITQSILLFWFIGLASLISGIILTGTVSVNLGIFHYLRRIEYMLLFFIAVTTIKNTKQVKIFLTAMLIVTVAVTLYGFGQIYLEFPVISTTNREFSKGQILTLTTGTRPSSTFAGHYDLAAYLSIALVFACTMFFYYRKTLEKIIILISSAVSFALLGLTAARVSFVAAIFGVSISFLLLKKKVLIGFLIAATLVAIVAIPQLRHRLVATITVNLLEGGGPKYEVEPGAVNNFTQKAVTVGEASKSVSIASQENSLNSKQATQSSQAIISLPADIVPGEPVNTTELGVYRSFNIRFDVEWPRAIRAFLKNPFLGTGYSSLTIATDNDYLRSLGETGILGFLSLALVFFVLIKKFIRALSRLENFERYFMVATICSMAVIFSTAIFIDIFEASKIATLFWIILGIAWGIARNYEDAK